MKKLLWACACLSCAVALESCVSVEPVRDIQRWPTATGVAYAQDIEKKAEAILSRMTVEEKVGQILQAEIQTITPEDIKQYHIGSVLNGGGSVPGRKNDTTPQDWLAMADDLWQASMDTSDGGVAIPVFWGTDAMHGNGNLSGATLFPHNIGLGAAHNRDLIQAIGEATAREVRVTGVEWVFAPTLAVVQDDRWGRTYESYSEDPQRVRDYAGAMVRGLQGDPGETDFLDENHVIATAKHFVADGGTWNGDDQGDARISERELVDIHGVGYPTAIDAGVQTVMASFSSWNGQKHHGSHYLLTEVLKGRMGFNGLVVGDWNGHGQVPGCTNHRCAEAVNAGIDLLMVPYDWKQMYTNTLEQVRAADISLTRLDDAVRRILRVKLKAGLFDKKPSQRALAGRNDIVGHPQHRALARKAVRESLVLLKNQGQLLPLNPQQKILVTGTGADNISMQAGGWSVSWQGRGIANERFPGATSIYSGIKSAVQNAGGTVELSNDGEFNEKPDVAIVVFGEQPYAEGRGDIDTLEFEPGKKHSLALLKSLKAKGIPVVSVFLSGRPMWVNPELNASDAFVAAWLPGSEGDGIADVIFADNEGRATFDFTGTLSFSWPKYPLQTLLNRHNADYDPLFAMGYGLNYSNSDENTGPLPESVPGLVSDDPDHYDLYVEQPLQPWGVRVRDYAEEQVLSGSFAQLPSGRVTAQTLDKEVQEDAIGLRWHDTWLAGLGIAYGEPMDLSGFMDAGVVSFELQVEDLANADLALSLHCGDHCERRLDITLAARALQGKGWQRMSFPLRCFAHPNDDFSNVTVPFELYAGGKGQLAMANVKLERLATVTGNCGPYFSVATTPARRYEYWTQNGWWDERWERNQQRLKQGNVDLLMLGDSIVEGWESKGRAIWDKYYAPRNAVNLGYGGDHTENLLWRLQNGELDGISPKAAVVMIGTNNTGHRIESPNLTAAGVRVIIDELRKRQPQMKILLLGVFPRDERSGTAMRTINTEINQIIKTYADGKWVVYLDINDAFLDNDGHLSPEIMPDFLHPNTNGYQIWADAMEPALEKLLGETP